MISGPLVYFRMFNTRVLILNSGKSALDLLETRSAIYSDRPKAWMLGVLAGRELAVFTVSFLHPRFKTYRKLLHAGLNPRAVREYSGIQMQETRTLLKGLVQTPENFVAHIKRYLSRSLPERPRRLIEEPEMPVQSSLRSPMGIRSIVTMMRL